MSKVKCDNWRIFTLELTRTTMYKADIKNYQVLINYCKILNKGQEVINKYQDLINSLQAKIDYIYLILDEMHWRDKDIMIRCYVKKYSNNMAGRKYNMSAEYINSRINKYLRKHIQPLLNMENLR